MLKEDFFPIQIIVSRELDEELHIWLTSLTRKLTASAAEMLVYRISELGDKDDRISASAVLNLAINANPKIFDVLKEETPMFEELQKLMKPHIDATVNEAVDSAVTKNTKRVKIDGIDACTEKLGSSLEKACEVFGMTVEEYEKTKAELAADSETEKPAITGSKK